MDPFSIGCVSSSRAWDNEDVAARSSCLGNGGILILTRNDDILRVHNLNKEELRVGEASKEAEAGPHI